MIYDAVMIFNIFQKVCLSSYLTAPPGPPGSTADANVNTEYYLLFCTDKVELRMKI
jgi:hypothetical protein